MENTIEERKSEGQGVTLTLPANRMNEREPEGAGNSNGAAVAFSDVFSASPPDACSPRLASPPINYPLPSFLPPPSLNRSKLSQLLGGGLESIESTRKDAPSLASR